MAEIPEHLLARSKARRQAIGQGEGDAPAADAPAASAAVERAADASVPAGAAAAAGLAPAKAPTAPAVAPAPPKRPEVLAAESRKKMPWWATTACLCTVLWAFLFAFTLEPRAAAESPAIAEGRHLYSPCAGCHGATGGGGVGPAFADGALIETFAAWEDQVEWVTVGTNDWPEATYGDTAKPAGGVGTMPGFGADHGDYDYTEEEILLVVRFEREILAEHGCEPTLAEATEEECAPGTEAATE